MIRDIEAAAEATRKTKDKAGKEKGNEKGQRKGGKGQGGRDADTGTEKEPAKKGKRWTKEDWGAWRNRLEEKKSDGNFPLRMRRRGKRSNAYVILYPLFTPGPHPVLSCPCVLLQGGHPPSGSPPDFIG